MVKKEGASGHRADGLEEQKERPKRGCNKRGCLVVWCDRGKCREPGGDG